MKETKIEWDVHQYPENPRAFVTNGLNKFGSLEIEIVWPLYMHDGVAICNLIAHAIREGLKIEDGLYVAEVFPSPVLFIKTKAAHEDIEVYRVIFPDGNGNFPWDINGCLSCDERFKNQITRLGISALQSRTMVGKSTIFMCCRSIETGGLARRS